MIAAVRSVRRLRGLGWLQGVSGGRRRACHSKQRKRCIQMAGQLLSVYVVGAVGKSFLKQASLDSLTFLCLNFHYLLTVVPQSAQLRRKDHAWFSCRRVGFGDVFLFFNSIVIFLTPPKTFLIFQAPGISPMLSKFCLISSGGCVSP